MKKIKIHKFLYAISTLLVLGFSISFGMDVYNYNIYMGSAPLYAYAIVRTAEFIIPSIIIFIIGIIIKNKEN